MTARRASLATTRRIAVAGTVGVAVLIGTSLLTAAVYTGRAGEAYSPLNHYISELGELGVSRLAWLFDGGLVVSGTCLVVVMLGLAGRLSGWVRWIVGPVGSVAGVAGALVGIFPMNDVGPHGFAALTFFTAAWLAVGSFTLWLIVHGVPWPYPRALVAAGVATVVSYVAFLLSYRIARTPGVDPLAVPSTRPAIWAGPILEWLTLAGIVAWVALLAWGLAREAWR